MISIRQSCWLQLIMLWIIKFIRCVFLLLKKRQTIIGVGFQICFVDMWLLITSGYVLYHIEMQQLKIPWPEFFSTPIEYHWYCSQHFVYNFSTKFRNITLKNMLHGIFTNPSKQEFVILYKDPVGTSDVIGVWIKV